MALTQLSHPFDEIHGALGKNDKIINRRKKFRDDRGRVIAEGNQEAYVVKHPRNWKKNPPKGAELTNINLWSEACRRSSQILFVARLDQTPADQQQHMLDLELRIRKMNQIPEYYTLDEARLLLAKYKTRFDAQIPGKRGSHPDPQAPIDPIKGSGKRYLQFHAFLRAILYRAATIS